MGIAHDLIPIVQALAASDTICDAHNVDGAPSFVCILCHDYHSTREGVTHTDACPVKLARAEIEPLERAVGDAGECTSCKAPITWIAMASGKRMPVDQRRLSITTKDGRTVTGWESHFATCPGAGQHRRR